MQPAQTLSGSARIDWVDVAKGICICLVVMMHSTLGVGEAYGGEGWMHEIVAFAKPFRMPDFFLIAGLFLARVIDRDWRDYLDRKVVHFVYFYLLWLSVQTIVRTPGLVSDGDMSSVAIFWLTGLVDPFSTLWFIYLLPVFFVVTKLARRVPPWIIFIIAAALESAPIATGNTLIDEFAARYVYFFTGYIIADRIFAAAALAQRHALLSWCGLGVWALVNGVLVEAGLSGLPLISLALGFAGALAIVAFSALVAGHVASAPLRVCGENSLVIYLSFFLPMAASRVISVRVCETCDVGSVSLLVTVVAVVSPLIAYWIVRGTPLKFFYVRPAWAYIVPPRATPTRVQAAE